MFISSCAIQRHRLHFAILPLPINADNASFREGRALKDFEFRRFLTVTFLSYAQPELGCSVNLDLRRIDHEADFDEMVLDLLADLGFRITVSPGAEILPELLGLLANCLPPREFFRRSARGLGRRRADGRSRFRVGLHGNRDRRRNRLPLTRSLRLAGFVGLVGLVFFVQPELREVFVSDADQVHFAAEEVRLHLSVISVLVFEFPVQWIAVLITCLA